MEAYPKPRHQYIYTPRYGQRGVLTYAGQTPNGAPPTGVIPNGGMGMGMGMGVGVGIAAGGYYPGVQAARSYYQPQYSSYYGGGGANYYNSYPSYYPSYTPAYSGYYNYNMYGCTRLLTSSLLTRGLTTTRCRAMATRRRLTFTRPDRVRRL
jgi:hypothetical protein